MPSSPTSPAPTRPALRSAVWFVTCSVLIGIYFVIPTAGKGGLYLLLGLVPAVAIAVGLRRFTPRRRAPWILLLGSFLLGSIGDALFWHMDLQELAAAPYPSLADVFYLAQYPVYAGALALAVRIRTGKPPHDRFIDASIIMTSCATLSWVFLIEPAYAAPGQHMLARLTSVAYPAMDLVLLWVAMSLLLIPGRRPLALQLLTVSLAITVGADMLYGLLSLSGDYQTGAWIDACWIIAFALTAYAATDRSMVELSIPQPPSSAGASMSMRRLTLLAFAAFCLPALMLVQWLEGAAVNVPAMALGSATIFTLVVIRIRMQTADLERSGTLLRHKHAELTTLHERLQRLQKHRRSLLHQTVASGETERQVLACELHDGAIQRLTALGYQLEQVRGLQQRGERMRAEEVLAGAQQRLGNVIDELRDVMSGLRPPSLIERGLEAALQDLAGTFRARYAGTRCHLEVSLPPARLGPDLELLLYRLVQEGIKNVAKHAVAANLWIELCGDESGTLLTIRDDGAGFDATALRNTRTIAHYGLALIQERTEMAGGTYELESTPGAGTRIEVSIPNALVGARRAS